MKADGIERCDGCFRPIDGRAKGVFWGHDICSMCLADATHPDIARHITSQARADDALAFVREQTVQNFREFMKTPEAKRLVTPRLKVVK